MDGKQIITLPIPRVLVILAVREEGSEQGMALDGGLERAWQPGLYARGNAQQITGVLLVSIPQGLLREQMGATPTEALRIQQALGFVGMVLGVLLLQLLGHVLTFVFFIFLFVCFIFLYLSLFSLLFSVLAHHFLLYFVPHLPSFRSYYSLKGVVGGVVASFVLFVCLFCLFVCFATGDT